MFSFFDLKSPLKQSTPFKKQVAGFNHLYNKEEKIALMPSADSLIDKSYILEAIQ
jgi:hypothetical protein